eukprot:gb/GECG01013900.1/.p1 GENE.gb/GECG01013900.1/~~gb/GECG01013900.1/.p1  ORF type:complete len:164 (+),score=9.46 gb/GECG01013900.1/:1-492(+)
MIYESRLISHTFVGDGNGGVLSAGARELGHQSTVIYLSHNVCVSIASLSTYNSSFFTLRWTIEVATIPVTPRLIADSDSVQELSPVPVNRIRSDQRNKGESIVIPTTTTANTSIVESPDELHKSAIKNLCRCWTMNPPSDAVDPSLTTNSRLVKRCNPYQYLR